jgi:hypothetical protein
VMTTAVSTTPAPGTFRFNRGSKLIHVSISTKIRDRDRGHRDGHHDDESAKKVLREGAKRSPRSRHGDSLPKIDPCGRAASEPCPVKIGRSAAVSAPSRRMKPCDA